MKEWNKFAKSKCTTLVDSYSKKQSVVSLAINALKKKTVVVKVCAQLCNQVMVIFIFSFSFPKMF